MVKLTKMEEECVTMLEQRLKILNEGIKPATGQSLVWYKQEIRSLLWVLEVVHHAAMTNCEDAFAFTTLRAPGDQEVAMTKAMLRRNAGRLEAKLAKWKDHWAGRTAARTKPGESPAS